MIGGIVSNFGVYNETMNSHGPEALLGYLKESLASGDLEMTSDAIQSALDVPQSPEADALEAVGMRIGILGVLTHGSETINKLEQRQPATNEEMKEYMNISGNTSIKDIKAFIASFNSSVRGVVVPGVEPQERQKLVLEAFSDYVHSHNNDPDSRKKVADVIIGQLSAQQLPGAPTVDWLQKNAIETADSVTDRLWDVVTELRESQVDRHTQQKSFDSDLEATWHEEFGAVRQVVHDGISYLRSERNSQ